MDDPPTTSLPLLAVWLEHEASLMLQSEERRLCHRRRSMKTKDWGLSFPSNQIKSTSLQLEFLSHETTSTNSTKTRSVSIFSINLGAMLSRYFHFYLCNTFATEQQNRNLGMLFSLKWIHHIYQWPSRIRKRSLLSWTDSRNPPPALATRSQPRNPGKQKYVHPVQLRSHPFVSSQTQFHIPPGPKAILKTLHASRLWRYII